jgi:hypothetical protein
MKVTATHPGCFDLKNYVSGARGWIREIAYLEVSISSEYNTPHLIILTKRVYKIEHFNCSSLLLFHQGSFLLSGLKSGHHLGHAEK